MKKILAFFKLLMNKFGLLNFFGPGNPVNNATFAVDGWVRIRFLGLTLVVNLVNRLKS